MQNKIDPELAREAQALAREYEEKRAAKEAAAAEVEEIAREREEEVEAAFRERLEAMQTTAGLAQKEMLGKPLAEKVRYARFLEQVRNDRGRPGKRPKKPKPKHREALLEKKAEAQGWGGSVNDA